MLSSISINLKIQYCKNPSLNYVFQICVLFNQNIKISFITILRIHPTITNPYWKTCSFLGADTVLPIATVVPALSILFEGYKPESAPNPSSPWKTTENTGPLHSSLKFQSSVYRNSSVFTLWSTDPDPEWLHLTMTIWLPCLLHKSATETFLLETNSRTGTMAAFQTTTSRFISTYSFLSISSNFQCKLSISCTKSICFPTKKGKWWSLSFELLLKLQIHNAVYIFIHTH